MITIENRIDADTEVLDQGKELFGKVLAMIGNQVIQVGRFRSKNAATSNIVNVYSFFT